MWSKPIITAPIVGSCPLLDEQRSPCHVWCHPDRRWLLVFYSFRDWGGSGTSWSVLIMDLRDLDRAPVALELADVGTYTARELHVFIGQEGRVCVIGFDMHRGVNAAELDLDAATVVRRFPNIQSLWSYQRVILSDGRLLYARLERGRIKRWELSPPLHPALRPATSAVMNSSRPLGHAASSYAMVEREGALLVGTVLGEICLHSLEDGRRLARHKVTTGRIDSLCAPSWGRDLFVFSAKAHTLLRLRLRGHRAPRVVERVCVQSPERMSLVGALDRPGYLIFSQFVSYDTTNIVLWDVAQRKGYALLTSTLDCGHTAPHLSEDILALTADDEQQLDVFDLSTIDLSGLEALEPVVVGSDAPPWLNRSIALTGPFEAPSRAARIRDLEWCGLQVVGSMSKSTTALLVGSRETGRLKDARRIGVPILRAPEHHVATGISYGCDVMTMWGILRDALSEPPSVFAWRRIVCQLNAWPEALELEMALDYIEAHTGDWPDAFKCPYPGWAQGDPRMRIIPADGPEA